MSRGRPRKIYPATYRLQPTNPSLRCLEDVIVSLGSIFETVFKTMKIHSRPYPVIIIAAYVIFLLIGILLGFGPTRDGEGHGQSVLTQPAIVMLGTLV